MGNGLELARFSSTLSREGRNTGAGRAIGWWIGQPYKSVEWGRRELDVRLLRGF